MTANGPTPADRAALVVGASVRFTTAPTWAPHLDGIVFTIEHATYGLGGMMDAQTRADIAAGWPHLVLVDRSGRRYGATGRRVRVVS